MPFFQKQPEKQFLTDQKLQAKCRQLVDQLNFRCELVYLLCTVRTRRSDKKWAMYIQMPTRRWIFTVVYYTVCSTCIAKTIEKL